MDGGFNAFKAKRRAATPLLLPRSQFRNAEDLKSQDTGDDADDETSSIKPVRKTSAKVAKGGSRYSSGSFQRNNMVSPIMEDDDEIENDEPNLVPTNMPQKTQEEVKPFARSASSPIHVSSSTRSSVVSSTSVSATPLLLSSASSSLLVQSKNYVRNEEFDFDGTLLKPIASLPERHRIFFNSYKFFNVVQTRTYEAVYESNDNILVAAPTGCGKTGPYHHCYAKFVFETSHSYASAHEVIFHLISPSCVDMFPAE